MYNFDEEVNNMKVDSSKESTFNLEANAADSTEQEASPASTGTLRDRLVSLFHAQFIRKVTRFVELGILASCVILSTVTNLRLYDYIAQNSIEDKVMSDMEYETSTSIDLVDTYTDIGTSDELVSTDVLMKVNGVEFTYSDVKDALIEYEKAALLDLADLYVQDMYFGTYELTDAEFEKQVAVLKGSATDEDWQAYLDYNGMTLDDLRANMEYSAQYQLKLEEKLNNITYTEDDAQEIYNDNPEYYQNCELDLIYVQVPEVVDVLMQDISSISMSPAQCLSYYEQNQIEGLISDYITQQKISILTEDFGVNLHDAKVGDVLTAASDELTIIGVVRSVNTDFDSVKADIIENEKTELAHSQIEADLLDLYDTVDFELYGEKAMLSTELNIK